MYFLIPVLDDIGQALLSGLRYILLMLCDTIYKLIIWAFELFMYVGKAEIFTNDFVLEIYKRVGLVLGIFMLFRLTFSLIQMMVDPNQITDKDKGAGSLVKKILVVIVLLGMVPTIFSEAFRLQGLILDEQIIAKIVLGKKNINMSNFAPYFSYYMFSNFYTYSGVSDSDGVCSESFYTYDLPSSVNQNKNFELAYKCLNKEPESGDNSYVTNFDGWTAIAIGGFTLWVIVMYVITLGMRVAKLAFLQLIAPIPILSYLSPKKETGFQKWIQQCLSTYLDVFIRLGIIYFAMLLVNLLSTSGDVDSVLVTSTGTSDPTMLNWVKLIIIIGILLFAKKAPELLGEIFPGFGGKAGLDFGIGLKSRTDVAGKGLIKRAAGAASTIPIMAGQRAFQNFNRKKLNSETGELEKRKMRNRVGSALAGVVSGSLRGLYYGGKDEKIFGGIKQGVGSQSKSSAAINKWVESGGTSNIDRVITGVAKKVGLSTEYEKIKAEIDGKDREIKKHKTIADSGANVNSAKDTLVDFAKGKVTSRENKNALGSDGLNILASAIGLNANELSSIGITADTSIGDASYLTSAAAERIKEQVKTLDKIKVNPEHFKEKYKNMGLSLSDTDLERMVIQETQNLEKQKSDLISQLSKLENNKIIEKKLSEFAVNQAIIGGDGIDIHPAVADNIKTVLNNAEIAQGIFAASTDETIRKKAVVINNLIDAIKNVQETHTFTSFPDPTGISVDDNGNPKPITSAYDLLDKLATFCNNQANDEKRIVAKIEEEKRAKEAEIKTIRAKANDEYNGK